MSPEKVKEIGLTIRKARVSRKMRQQDLAELVYVKQTTISRVELGKDLDVNTLIDIFHVLDLSMDNVLLDREAYINPGTIEHEIILEISELDDEMKLKILKMVKDIKSRS